MALPEVEDMLAEPWHDLARDTVLGVDATGTPRAYMTLVAPPGDTSEKRLFTRAGLAPLRWYASRKRDLADPLPDVLVPDGIRLAEWTPGDGEEVRAWPISLRPEGAGGPIFLLTHPAIARAVARQAHGGAAV